MLSRVGAAAPACGEGRALDRIPRTAYDKPSFLAPPHVLTQNEEVKAHYLGI